jgi:predicted protein tyrosine phosphatase
VSGVLRLSFPDAEVPSDLHVETSLFSREQAMEIWTFTEKHLSQIERVIVHCDASVSRSPAVAAALARVLNDDDTEFFGGRYRPNMHVYRFPFWTPALPRRCEHIANPTHGSSRRLIAS